MVTAFKFVIKNKIFSEDLDKNFIKIFTLYNLYICVFSVTSTRNIQLLMNLLNLVWITCNGKKNKKQFNTDCRVLPLWIEIIYEYSLEYNII